MFGPLIRRLAPCAAIVAWALSLPTPVTGADWSNSGGNAGRNGLTTEVGPTAATLAWSGGRSSLISWLPVTEGDRVFLVRQLKWPEQQPGDAPVVAYDLITGAEIWVRDIPYQAGDWITWVGGVKNGRVYASRGGNGASVAAPLYALDATDGHILWSTDFEIDAGAYDGMVFAPNGDPIIASFEDIWRVRATDGALVWHAPRVGSVSGECGGCLYGDAFYVADAVPGGHAIVRYDANTGAEMYQSPTMPGFTIQNTPMVGKDGTVYLARYQNNPSVDFLYAWTDTGAGFVERWHIPVLGGAAAEYGTGPDGTLYFTIPGPRLARLNPNDGSIINQSAPLTGFNAARIAVDDTGIVYLGNMAFGTGRLVSYNADLTVRWSVNVPSINIGGPSLGRYGTLVVCGTGTDVRAYRTTNPNDVADGDLAHSENVLSVFPNPFRGETMIAVSSVSVARPTVLVMDASGRIVRHLEGPAGAASGPAFIMWDGRGDGASDLPAGTYFLRIDGMADGGSASATLIR